MTRQLTLADIPTGHEDEVFDLFVRFAEQARAAGHKRYSARTIGERIRWECSLRTPGPVWKCNDHLWPKLARKLVAERPEFVGFFELRGRKTA